MRPTRELIVRAARMTGYPVKLAWSSHDKGDMGDVRGVVEHHTGTPVNYDRLDDYPTLRVVRDGRPGLVNSLSAYGLGRSGTVYCISEKLSWHAGTAWWGGTADVNGHFLGVEAESDGTYWTREQEDCYPRLSAAILHVFGRGVGDHPRHAQVARPSGRKSDWSGLDDDAFDRAVAGYLAFPSTIPRTSQEDELSAAEVAAINRHTDEVRDELYRMLASGKMPDGKVSPAHAYVSLTGLRSAIDLQGGRLDALSAVRLAVEALGDDEASIRDTLHGVEARLVERIDQAHAPA